MVPPAAFPDVTRTIFSPPRHRPRRFAPPGNPRNLNMGVQAFRHPGLARLFPFPFLPLSFGPNIKIDIIIPREPTSARGPSSKFTRWKKPNYGIYHLIFGDWARQTYKELTDSLAEVGGWSKTPGYTSHGSAGPFIFPKTVNWLAVQKGGAGWLWELLLLKSFFLGRNPRLEHGCSIIPVWCRKMGEAPAKFSGRMRIPAGCSSAAGPINNFKYPREALARPNANKKRRS